MQKINNYKIILKYLFVPGLILTVSGLVPIFLTQTQSILYLSLVIMGGIFLFTWLVYLLVTGRSFWQKRSTQIGTNAFIATLSLLIILALINFIAVSYSPRIDLTENELYTLSLETQEIIKNLDKPTKVYIFDKEIKPQDEDLLENYQRYNDNFKFELIDPDIKVGITQQFNVQSLGDVYLEYEDKKQLVQTLITFNQRESLSEIKLTNAIATIQQDYIPKIYLLQGHGEYSLEPTPEGSLSEATQSLESKGYEVRPLNIVENGGIPEDADVIIIASPKRQLFDQEVTALKEYSDKGGNLFLMLDPNTDPGLEPILKDWGIKLDNRIVIDGSGAGNIVGLGPTTPFITSYGNHPITEEFANSISFYPLSRPVDTIEVENVQATSLIVTSEQMWAESNLESEEVIFDPQEDISGPFDLGVALTRSISSETVDNKIEPEETNNSQDNSDNNKTEDNNSKEIDNNSNKETDSNKDETKNNNNAEQEDTENEMSDTTDNQTDSNKDETENNNDSEKKDSESESNNTTDNQNDSNKDEKNEIKNNNNSEQETEQKHNDANKDKIESRLVIIGNSTFATNNLFNQQLNGDVFLNTVQWLSNQDEQPLSIRPKQVKDRRLNLSPLQATIVPILSLAVFPLLGLIAAGITWWRRR
ncbi:Gldg family protein [Crocosphaera sp.]|uniref:GldG family protein n=1 Tax=Crocosphaera sp. TaxID=2729996 RepID=UPI00262E90D1|nr:Gldg family protein [Crocosphaera sp.]MDJ0578718.1 Gldg family protein [Crocosphaera sp.]